MGSKAEVVNILVGFVRLLPHVGLGILLGNIVACVISFVRDRKRNFLKFKIIAWWTIVYATIYLAVMACIWLTFLPDAPLAR